MYHWRFEIDYLKNIDMFTFVEIYTLWIKLLKLALSSNNGPYPKHGGHVSNLKKHNPLKGLAPRAHLLLLLWMHLLVQEKIRWVKEQLG
jgi:hypothetical protein